MEHILTTPKAKIHWHEIDELLRELYQLTEEKLDEEGCGNAQEWLELQVHSGCGDVIDDLIRRLVPAIQSGSSPLSGTSYKGFGFVERSGNGEPFIHMLVKAETDLFVEKTGDADDE